MTGFGPDTRGSQKWRKFSPADVLRLATVRSLKQRTQVAISEQAGLLGFIGDKAFVLDALGLWRAGRQPTLVSDLSGFHEVRAVADVDLGRLVKRGDPLFVVLSLDGPVRLANKR